MILLDENTLRSQREFLEARRLPVRKVAFHWGREEGGLRLVTRDRRHFGVIEGLSLEVPVY